jgi:hypothetical protein
MEISTDHSRELLENSSQSGKSHELEGISEKDADALAKKAAASGNQLLIINLGQPLKATYGFGFLHAYRSDLIGLLTGAGIVVVLVGIAWALLQL